MSGGGPGLGPCASRRAQSAAWSMTRGDEGDDMVTRVRVATLAELPPGKGKGIALGHRLVTVYTVEGRLVAPAPTCHPPEPPPHVDTTQGCGSARLPFEVFAEDSPAALRTDGQRCAVLVREQE